jgi:hypothetical protein
LQASEIWFGAWGIGGPAMADRISIGWGDVMEGAPIHALEEGRKRGITTPGGHYESSKSVASGWQQT